MPVAANISLLTDNLTQIHVLSSPSVPVDSSDAVEDYGSYIALSDFLDAQLFRAITSRPSALGVHNRATFTLKLSLYRVLREGGLVGPQGPKGDQGAAGSDGTGVVRITRAAYDALAVKDANTLYAVIG